MQARGGVVCRDRQRLGSEYRTGIQAPVHLHDRYPGERVTREDGTLNRRGAAPARQKRSVDIDRAQTGQGEHRLGQNQPVSRDHHGVCAERAQARERRLVFQADGLIHFEAAFLRQGFYRAGREPQPPACGPVGLGKHQRDVMPRMRERSQGARSELRGAGEYEAHRRAGVR